MRSDVKALLGPGAPPVVDETVRRALAIWGAADDPLYAMGTAPNRQRYGTSHTRARAQWLSRLGYDVGTVEEDALPGLGPGSTLVLSSVYLIPSEVAGKISRPPTVTGHDSRARASVSRSCVAGRRTTLMALCAFLYGGE